MRVDTNIVEHTFHTEGSRFIRDNRNDVLADLFVFAQSAEQRDRAHRCRDLFAVVTINNLAVIFESWDLIEKRRFGWTRGYWSSEFVSPLFHIFDFGTVFGQLVEWCVDDFVIRDRNPKATAEL